MSGAITISTIGDLIEHGYTLTAWCKTDGARPIDLNKLAERFGRDTTYIRPQSPIRIRCAVCGERMTEWTIAPRYGRPGP